MGKHKRDSRSRSRSRSPRKDRRKERDWDRDRDRDRERDNDRYRERSPKNKRRYSPSSSDNSNDERIRRSTKQEQEEIQQPKYKIQQTKVLKIDKCHNLVQAERALIDISITAGTSVPDEVQLKEGAIYAKYPSVEVSTLVKQKVKDFISFGGNQYSINFYPFNRIDLNMAYDWYCQKCDYKNFARRNKCYRCDSEKTSNCKLNYSSAAVAPSKNIPKEENINNCSLMVRGPVIIDTQEEILLSIFESFCSVKDIRMIKNKMTGQLKDFAFIEFFTPQDAALALKHTTNSDFRIKGQKVSVMYSRNKSDDDYAKPLPYEKKQRRRQFQTKKDEPVENYYNRQRQLQIEQQKLRPIITIQQLKQKRELEMKKKVVTAKELTQEQMKRRQAEQMAKQWEKQAKMQNTIMYICVPCQRKFKGENQMKNHENLSQLHKFNKQKMELAI